MKLNADRLRELVAYEPETGIMRWRQDRGGCRCAGKTVGSISTGGYRQAYVEGRAYVVHHLAWLYAHGVWPTDEIDHINGDRLDNRLSNLRPASRHDNVGNTKVRKDATSGVKGVSWHPKTRQWRARIVVNKRRVHLGLFTEKSDAARAYRSAAESYFGGFAYHLRSVEAHVSGGVQA